MSPRDGRCPDAPNVEATRTADTTTDQGNGSTAESTAAPSLVDCYSAASRLKCARHFLEPMIAQARAVGPLPAPGTPEWVAADLETKLAGTSAAYLAHLEAQALAGLVAARNRRVARQDRRDFLVAQREASHAVSAALDWSAASRQPSHAELERRRSIVVVPS